MMRGFIGAAIKVQHRAKGGGIAEVARFVEGAQIKAWGQHA